MKLGVCRTKYGTCSKNSDCGDSGLLCSFHSGKLEGVCICNNIDEQAGDCGLACSNSDQCPQKCQ